MHFMMQCAGLQIARIKTNIIGKPHDTNQTQIRHDKLQYTLIMNKLEETQLPIIFPENKTCMKTITRSSAPFHFQGKVSEGRKGYFPFKVSRR
jgi:hypothetical protein